MSVTFYEGSEPLKIKARTIFEAVKSIQEAGQEEEFLAKCDELDARVLVEADHINLVKTFVFEGGIYELRSGARRIIDSDRC